MKRGAYFKSLANIIIKLQLGIMISFYRLNPLSLVQICTPILEQYQDKDEALKFIEKIGEKVKSNPEAFALTKVLQGKIQLDCFNNVEKTKVSFGRYILIKAIQFCYDSPILYMIISFYVLVTGSN